MSTPTNKGSQQVFFQYGDPLTGAEFDGKDLSVAALGIYSGALLNVVDNADVSVSPWTAVISDGEYTVTARTAAAYTVPNVSSTTNVIVLRWYYNTANSWFVDMLAVASGNVLANDLIIGVAIYSGGGAITGFNYSARNNPMAITNFLKVVPTTPNSMKVLINGGWCSYGLITLYVPTQLLSSSITPPVANPRIDVIYVNSSGSVGVLTGVEAVTPSPQSIVGVVPLALITLQPSTTSIAQSMIQDSRPICSITNYVPTPTISNQAANKSYVDSSVNFGAVTPLSQNQSYQAPTNGFVFGSVYSQAGDSGNQSSGADIYVSLTSPATNDPFIELTCYSSVGGGSTISNYSSFCIPVAKGEWYGAFTFGPDTSSVNLYFRPFGM